VFARELFEATNPGAASELGIGPTFEELLEFASEYVEAPDVLRYMKNEYFGLSLTYYENNRPRQYFPDFIVLVKDRDGREVWWLAETKGEIRESTSSSASRPTSGARR
jgi:hypothetical protein